MNETDEMKRQLVLAQLRNDSCQMGETISKLYERLEKELDKISKIREKPKTILNLSPAEVTDLLDNASQTLRLFGKDVRRFFSVYKRANKAMQSIIESESNNK